MLLRVPGPIIAFYALRPSSGISTVEGLVRAGGRIATAPASTVPTAKIDPGQSSQEHRSVRKPSDPPPVLYRMVEPHGSTHSDC